MATTKDDINGMEDCFSFLTLMIPWHRESTISEHTAVSVYCEHVIKQKYVSG